MKEDELSKAVREMKDMIFVLTFMGVATIALLLGLIFWGPEWSRSDVEPVPVLCWDRDGYVYDCEPMGGK